MVRPMEETDGAVDDPLSRGAKRFPDNKNESKGLPFSKKKKENGAPWYC